MRRQFFASAPRSRAILIAVLLAHAAANILALPPAIGRAHADEPPVFQLKWGSRGTAPGQFDSPTGVGLDASGNVYVADLRNHRIQKFLGDGTFVTAWGTLGAGDGQLNLPYCALAHDGRIYVVDSGNHRVCVFDENGGFIGKWGAPGVNFGQFNTPVDVAVSAAGLIYVVDLGNSRIQVFESDYDFIRAWGTQGSADGQFIIPYGIAVDANSDVFVVEFVNARVQKFNFRGDFITKWGVQGMADGEFLDPFRVAIDANNDVFVADYHNHRIQKFDTNGVFLTKWGAFGTGDGQFDHSSGLVVDSAGTVYAADLENHRMQKFGDAAVGVSPASSGGALPASVVRLVCAPNPFAEQTTIAFSIQSTARARVRVISVEGAPVRELESGAIADARSRVAWDGRDASGRAAPSGVYFVLVEGGGISASAKLTLTR